MTASPKQGLRNSGFLGILIPRLAWKLQDQLQPRAETFDFVSLHTIHRLTPTDQRICRPKSYGTQGATGCEPTYPLVAGIRPEGSWKLPRDQGLKSFFSSHLVFGIRQLLTDNILNLFFSLLPLAGMNFAGDRGRDAVPLQERGVVTTARHRKKKCSVVNLVKSPE